MGNFIAFAQAPTITSITPTTIQPGGTITITGTNFSRASSVTVGGIGVYRYWVSSPTSITAVVGAGFTGSGNVVVNTTNGTSNGSTITVNAGVVFANAPTTAVRVLGQSTYTTRTAGNGPNAMDNPNMGAVDPTTGKVFLADYHNHRVLRFANYAALTDGIAAEAVLGQTGFGPSASGNGAAEMNNPFAVHVDGAGRLWVADWGNSRVLRFDNASAKTSGASADGVLGQSDFGLNAQVTTRNGMKNPGAIFADGGGRLWVADLPNHRVLRYDDAATKANGADADGVLGQTDFTSGTSSLSASGLNEPFGLAVSGAGDLWLVDRGNKRVLRYNNAVSKANGGSADAVLGQTDFISNTGDVTQSKFNVLQSLTLDGAGRLWVTEFNSNRVLRFDNARSKADGANADAVLGQPDFTSSAQGLAQDRFFQVKGAWTDDAGLLWIADGDNNRVLVFDYVPPTPATTVTVIVSTLNFGTSIASGSATTQTVNLIFGNIANGERVTYTLSGTNASNFTANTSGFSTNATQTIFSTSVTVTFTPGSGIGTSVATLTITTQSGATNSTVSLLANVIAPTPATTLTVNASTLNFGTSIASGATTTQTVNLTFGNIASGERVSYTLGGTNSANFTANTSGFSTNATQTTFSTSVTVTFTPGSSIGTSVATLTIGLAGTTATTVVNLTANVVAPTPATTVTVNVSTLNFGTNTTSGSATTQTVNITFANIANGERVSYTLGGTNVSNFTANTSGFSTNATQTTFSTSVTVTFTPGSGVGTSVATLTIGLAGTTATTVVNLTANVVAPTLATTVTVNVSTLNFGTSTVSGGTTTQTVNITFGNIANGERVSYALGGTNSANFTANTSGFSTNATQTTFSTSVTITFTPGSGIGTSVATLTIGLAGTTATTVVNLTANVVAPTLATTVTVNVSTLNFGTNTASGSATTQTVNITFANIANGERVSYTLGGTNVSNFTANTSGFSTNATQTTFSTSVTVTFTPGSGIGTSVATLTIGLAGTTATTVVNLTANITASNVVPVTTLTVSPTSVNFGTIELQNGAVTTTVNLSFTNIGAGEIVTYTVSGAQAGSYTLNTAGFTSSSQQATLATSITITLTPTGIGVSSASVSIQTRSNSTSSSVALTALVRDARFVPTITSFASANASNITSLQQGSTLTIIGTNLNGVQEVRFFGENGVLVPVTSTTGSDRITVIVPSTTSGTGQVFIRNGFGTVLSPSFTIPGPPVVTAVSSVRIRGGQTLTITGTNLSSAEVRFFGESGTVAGIVSNSATSIGVTVPIMDDARGRVFIRTPNGTVLTDTIDVFGKPVVTSLSSNLLVEGTVLTINGFNLDSLSSVRFFDTEGVFGTIVSANANQVQVRVPSALTMKGRSPDVTGQILLVTNTSGFTRTQTVRAIGAPFINSFSGVANTTVGVGGTLTINAGAFLDVLTEARFFGVNGALSPSISTSANNVISITVPSNPTATTGQVVLRNAAGTTATVPITLIFPPTVTRLSTTSIAPGQPLTITGTNLASVTEVRFFGTNGILATITSRTAQSLVCTVPSDAIGSGQVVVVNPGGSALAPTLTIIPAPTITDIQPRSTQSLDTVVITGQNFTPVTTVRIRYSSGYNVTCAIISRTDGQLRVRMPDAVGPGPDPRLILEGLAGNATSSFALGFAGFTIDRVSPTEITVQSTISLFGSNIGALSRVFFFGTGGAEGTIVSKTSREVVVRPPSNATGSGRVYVWSTMGDREFSPASIPISIVIQPTITSISANFAKQVGIPDVNIAPRGELITITGTNLERITEVRFFGASGALGTVISSSGTQCIVRVPESVVGGNTGQIFIRNIAGTVLSPTVTFVDRPNITTVRAVLGGSNNPPDRAVANRKFQVFSPTGGSNSTLARVTRAHFFGVNGVRVDLVRDPDFDARFLMCVVPTTATRNTTNDIDTVYVVSPTGYDRFAVKYVNVPRITSISPATARPGDVVTMTGTDLDQLTEVRFFGSTGVSGNILAGEYTTARVELPAVSNRVNYNQRSGAIFASNIAGSSSRIFTQQEFNIASTPPVVDSIVPLVAREGDTLRLFGPNVIDITSVRFFGLNGTVAPIFDRNVRSVSVRVPSGMYGRKDNLGVFNGFGGNLTAQEVGIGRAPSSITTVTPSSFSAGDTILIRGTDLLYVNDVRFFGITGTPGSIVSQSQDNLVVAIPRVTGAQSGQIFVRSPLGTALSVPTASYRSPVADAPIITDVSGIGTTFATVTFTAPTTGRGIPSSFRIEIQPTGTATLATVPFNASTVSYTVQLRGLAPGAVNTVLVYSVNATGTSAPATRRFTTLSTAGLPGVPTNLRVSRVFGNADSIEFAWSPPPTGGTPTSYRVNVYQFRNSIPSGDIERVGFAIVQGTQTTVTLRAGSFGNWNDRTDEYTPRSGSLFGWFDSPQSYATAMRVVATNATGSAATQWTRVTVPARPGTPYSDYALPAITNARPPSLNRPERDGRNITTESFEVQGRVNNATATGGFNQSNRNDRTNYSAVQQFEFQLLGSDDRFTNALETRTIDASQSGTDRIASVTFRGLSNGQRYSVRITALNGDGTRRSESITTAVIILLGTNPAPPELLRIADVQISVANAGFTGRWVALSGAGGTPEGYDVQLSNERGILTDTLEVNTLDTKTPSYQFRNLSNEATYRFRVRSYNNNRTQFSPWTVSPSASLQNLRAQDSLTLRMIYANSGGTSWRKQANWNSRLDIDAWQGVIIENDRVVGLILTNNNMSSLSDSIRRLSALRVLSLRGNSIRTFPAGIRQLRNLQVLELDGNQLSGELGSLAELTNLQVARFDQNSLTSLASTVFGSSTPLRVFNAENNQLTALPATLLNATQLRVMAFSNNQISSWSGNLSVLTGLQSVLFSNNRLTAIPTFTSNASTLLHFNMQSNRLSGTAITANASLATNARITYLIDRQTLLTQANMADDIFTPMLMAKQDVLSASGVDAVVYPTPAQSEVFVRLAVRTGGLYRLVICNMQGQSVSAPYNEVLGVGEHTLRLPIHHLASGSYMLMLTSPAYEGKPLRYPVMIVR